MAAVNDVYKIRFGFSCFRTTAYVVRHWIVTAVAGAGRTDAQIATAVDALGEPNFKNFLSVNARYEGTGVQKIFPLPATDEVVEAASAGIGSVAGDALPPQVAAVISLRSGLAGRRRRGRSYIPFGSENESTTEGFIGPTGLAALVGISDFLIDTIAITVGPDGVTLAPIVWSRSLLTSTLITNYRIRGSFGTQRRRSYLNAADKPVWS